MYISARPVHQWKKVKIFTELVCCLYYLIARLASRSEMHYKQYVWQSKLIAFGWRYKLGQLVANIIILRCTMRAGQVE